LFKDHTPCYHFPLNTYLSSHSHRIHWLCYFACFEHSTNGTGFRAPRGKHSLPNLSRAISDASVILSIKGFEHTIPRLNTSVKYCTVLVRLIVVANAITVHKGVNWKSNDSSVALQRKIKRFVLYSGYHQRCNRVTRGVPQERHQVTQSRVNPSSGRMP